MSDIAQKLKQGNIFWKIPMKIPVNRHYYSLVTENVDSICQTKTEGRGGGVYVLVVLRGEVDDPPDQTGGVCVLVFGVIDAPVYRYKIDSDVVPRSDFFWGGGTL